MNQFDWVTLQPRLLSSEPLKNLDIKYLNLRWSHFLFILKRSYPATDNHNVPYYKKIEIAHSVVVNIQVGERVSVPDSVTASTRQ